MINIYELAPTNGRKSFYGKAQVVIDKDGSETLLSYGTPVVRRTPNGSLERLYDGWSLTTGTHIKSFCGLTKKEFQALALCK